MILSNLNAAETIENEMLQENATGRSEENLDSSGPDPEGDITMGCRPSSPIPSSESNTITSQTPNPSERRLDIASICNPNHEVPAIRHHQTSKLFGDNLNAVQTPSWVKGSACEPFHVYLPVFSNWTVAELEVFLKGLTEGSIDCAIACFEAGIVSRVVLPGNFDPGRAQRACNRIHDVTVKGSTAMGDVNNLPKFWVNLTGLAHSSNLNAIESCITRVFCMRG